MMIKDDESRSTSFFAFSQKITYDEKLRLSDPKHQKIFEVKDDRGWLVFGQLPIRWMNMSNHHGKPMIPKMSSRRISMLCKTCKTCKTCDIQSSNSFKFTTSGSRKFRKLQQLKAPKMRSRLRIATGRSKIQML